MISNDVQRLKALNSNINEDLKFINGFVSKQRLTNFKSIEVMHKEHKKHLHISEYKLIIGLLKGLEASLMIEYFNYLDDGSTDTYLLFDVWAMDKLIRIYSMREK